MTSKMIPVVIWSIQEHSFTLPLPIQSLLRSWKLNFPLLHSRCLCFYLTTPTTTTQQCKYGIGCAKMTDFNWHLHKCSHDCAYCPGKIFLKNIEWKGRGNFFEVYYFNQNSNCNSFLTWTRRVNLSISTPIKSIFPRLAVFEWTP